MTDLSEQTNGIHEASEATIQLTSNTDDDCCWPSPARDTTQFPSIDMDISVALREHLEEFCVAEDKAWNYGGNQRFRTNRKMYERLGLIYKSNDLIKLSRFGSKLCSLQQNMNAVKDDLLASLRSDAISVLSRYQLRNPADDFDRPLDCDIMPYVAIWTAMLALDGKIHFEEMNRVLLRLKVMSGLTNAIEKLRAARLDIPDYATASELELQQHLGFVCQKDQPEARMAAWYSAAGWGGLIIARNADQQGFRRFIPGVVPEIKRITDDPPPFYEAPTVDAWFLHFHGVEAAPLGAEINQENLLGLAAAFQQDCISVGLIFDLSTVQRFVASCLAKPFVIITGLSGSGKTRLAQAFARWMTAEFTYSESAARFALVAVGADWVGKENLLGYPDALEHGRYVKTETLKLILRAKDDPERPYFLILDEMNLSHVERYFSDFLSAMESGERIALHANTETDEIITEMDNVPSFLQLPRNLFVIGTVNVDETTYTFSPKVLDRANSIEFRVNGEKMSDYLESETSGDIVGLNGAGRIFGRIFVQEAKRTVISVPQRERFRAEMKLLFDVLELYGAEFGFRTANEMARFINFHKLLSDSEWSFNTAFDAQICQKVLAKLNGSLRKLEPVLTALSVLCFCAHDWDEDSKLLKNRDELFRMAEGASAGTIPKEDAEGNPLARLSEDGKVLRQYPISHEKINRMLSRARAEGFTSYAER